MKGKITLYYIDDEVSCLVKKFLKELSRFVNTKLLVGIGRNICLLLLAMNFEAINSNIFTCCCPSELTIDNSPSFLQLRFQLPTVIIKSSMA